MKTRIVFLYAMFLFINQYNYTYHFECFPSRTMESLERYLYTRNYSVVNYHNLVKGSLLLRKEMTQGDGVQLIFSGVETVDIHEKLESLLVVMEYRGTVFARVPSGNVFRKDCSIKMETEESLHVTDEMLDNVISHAEQAFFRRLQE